MTRIVMPSAQPDPPAEVGSPPAAAATETPTAPKTPFNGDLLEEARETVIRIMRKGGRNAQAQLVAARLILSADWLSEISDEALLAEVKRRKQMAEFAGVVGAQKK